MIPISFEGENVILDKPPDMKREDCDPLPVKLATSENGHPLIISCWKLTKDEVEELIHTGRLWLVVWSTAMPPACITAHKPF